MSPMSSGTSIHEGIENIGDDRDTPPISDRERIRPPIPTRIDLKGKDPVHPPRPPAAFSPRSPNAARPSSSVPMNSTKFSNIPFTSTSIAQYSNDRLAERARLASLPTRSPSPPRVHPGGQIRLPSVQSISAYTKRPVGQSSIPEESEGSRHISPYSQGLHVDTSNLSRARRATVSWPASGSQPSFEQQQYRWRPSDEPPYSVASEEAKIKLERPSPPPLDLRAPEQPYSATHAHSSVENLTCTPSEAGPSRRRKRSKSTVYVPKDDGSANSPESEQTVKRGEKPVSNASLRAALESGDYEQVSDHSWYCKVHHENLGGPRSVTRHHDSVHLNIMVECEYCHGRFSRRDATLRHQRHSGCKARGRV